jgi:hypothetical protein
MIHEGNMVALLAVFIPIIGTIGLFTMIVFIRKYQNDEKMAMIAKGITPPQKASHQINPSHSLRWGFILVGFGVGLLMGSLLESLTNMDGETAHFSMIFIFGGLGLLASYFYQMNIDKKNNSKNND